MRVILYPRVSSKQQLKGDSIESQERRLRKYCEERGHEIVDVWTDGGKSASLKEDSYDISIKDGYLIARFNLNQRPAFRKMLDNSDKGLFDAICFCKWDRFSRSVVFAKLSKNYFDSKEIELIPIEDSADPLTSSIMQVLSEEEIRTKSERIRNSRLERFEQGKMVARSPYGYKFNKDKKTMNIDKKKADIVVKCFELTLQGIDYKAICKTLGLYPTQYYNIIRNKAYCGYVTFENVEKKGNHTPLVNEEVWEKVNKLRITKK